MDIETKLDQILKIVMMTQQDLAELKRNFQELKEQDVAGLKEDTVILKQDVAGLKEETVMLRQDVAGLKEDIAMLKQELAELKGKVANLEERVASLERSVFLIETEQGDRIKALFNAREANEDKHEEIINLCLSIKSEFQGTLFNHEKRISNLEGNLVPSF